MLYLPSMPTDSNTRSILAQYWYRVAFMEHASIGAFTRLILELLSLGAIPVILRTAASSVIDEIHHAEISFSLLSHYSGESIGPWEYPWIVWSWFRKVTKLNLAKEGFIDGLVGEGIAANIALWQSINTTDLALKNMFRIIYEDEIKHSIFWWEIVNWCFETSDSDEHKRLKKAFSKIFSELEIKYKNNEKIDVSDNELIVEGLSDYGMINKESYLRIRQDVYVESLLKLEELSIKYSF